MLAKKTISDRSCLDGFNRSAVAQANENLLQALRVLELVPQSASEFLPHPLVVVRAEIENARMLLRLHAAETSRGTRSQFTSTNDGLTSASAH